MPRNKPCCWGLNWAHSYVHLYPELILITKYILYYDIKDISLQSIFIKRTRSSAGQHEKILQSNNLHFYTVVVASISCFVLKASLTSCVSSLMGVTCGSLSVLPLIAHTCASLPPSMNSPRFSLSLLLHCFLSGFVLLFLFRVVNWFQICSTCSLSFSLRLSFGTALSIPVLVGVS